MSTVKFQGNPVVLSGEFIQAGTQAPDFSFVKGDLSTFSLADGKGKYLLLNIFPSLDTGVCDFSQKIQSAGFADGEYAGTGYLKGPAFRSGPFLYDRRN